MAKDRKLSTVKARGAFSDMLNRVIYLKERIILMRRGKPIAAVIPMEDFEVLNKQEENFDGTTS